MAKLPGIDAAVVADAKLTDYLLNLANSRGAAKARFLAGFGFALNRVEEARQAFMRHASENEIMASQQHRFGTTFEIDGPLPSPDGRNPRVRAVWMIDQGASAPRLITMVPLPWPEHKERS
jgi:hypothetical protein